MAILRPEQGGGSQGKNKRGKCEVMELHWRIPPCSLCTLSKSKMLQPGSGAVRAREHVLMNLF
jgi:hypothetical protein